VTYSPTEPTKFRVFEIYTSEAATEEHHKTSFQKVAKWASREGVMAGPIDVQKHVLNEDVEKGIVV
jgi:quinol monooxygenase YgiN